MNNKFNVLNVKLDSHIKLDISNMEMKQFTYVFAKNGVGKTTYTKKIKNNGKVILKIFNNDYIKKNIYTDKTSNNDKVFNHRNNNNDINTFNVLIGDNIVGIVNDLNKINDEKKNLKIDLDKIVVKGFINEIKHTKIKPPTFSDICKNIDLYEKIDEETLKNEITNKNNMINNIVINSEHINELNSYGKKLNECIKDISSYNDIAKNLYSEEKPAVIQLHEQALEINEDFNFAGIDITQNEIKAKFNEINNLKIGPAKIIGEKLSNVKNDFKKILEKESFKSISEINDIKNLIKAISDAINSISLPIDPTSLKKIPTFSKIKILEIPNKDKIQAEIDCYINSNKFKLLEEYDVEKFKLYKKLEKERKNKDAEKNRTTKWLDAHITKRINEFLKHFNSADIKLEANSATKTGTNGLLKLTFNNDREMAFLSEGEISTLAFSYFLTDLELSLVEKSDKPIIVVIDDPFNSNDHTRIYKFKNIPFVYEKQECVGIGGLGQAISKNNRDSKFVILTHNVQVIYSMISGLQKIGEFKNFSEINYDDSIEVREWTKDSNLVVDDNLETRAFFPVEKNILNNSEKLFKNLLIEKHNERDIMTFAYILMRMQDKINDDKRGKIKSIVQNSLWNNKNEYKPVDESQLIKFFKKEVGNEVFKKEEEYFTTLSKNISFLNKEKKWDKENNLNINEETFKKFDFDEIESKIMFRYLKRLDSHISNAYDNEEPELFRRLRHKEYLYSTLIAFGLEEF